MESNCLVIPYGNWKRQYLIGLPAILLLAFFFWRIAPSNNWPFHALPVFFLVLLAPFGETIIDPASSVVIRRWTVLKLVPVWLKRCALTEFSTIGSRFKDDQEGHRIWYVQLINKSGGQFDLKWIGYSQEFPAAAFSLQSRIAEVTGLPIKNECH